MGSKSLRAIAEVEVEVAESEGGSNRPELTVTACPLLETNAVETYPNAGTDQAPVEEAAKEQDLLTHVLTL